MKNCDAWENGTRNIKDSVGEVWNGNFHRRCKEQDKVPPQVKIIPLDKVIGNTRLLPLRSLIMHYELLSWLKPQCMPREFAPH